jgi:hypothetical protein
MRSRRSIQIRRIREWLALCAAIALIPWTISLAFTLPESYTAEHWQAAWVGFDVLLLVFIIATAVLGFAHHHWLTLFAFAFASTPLVRRLVRRVDRRERRLRYVGPHRRAGGAAACGGADHWHAAHRAPTDSFVEPRMAAVRRAPTGAAEAPT